MTESPLRIRQAIQAEAYQQFLSEVLNCVGRARLAAAKGINQTQLHLYIEIGTLIVQTQERYGWGKSVVERLSSDLKERTGASQGFSPQNLWLMRQAYLEYRDQPELRRLVEDVPWSHNVLILQKVKDAAARLYYLRATTRFGWTRNVLLNQIKAGAYERSLKNEKVHNFPAALPEHLAEQAEETLKSSYNLEFLGIGRAMREHELEDRLIERLQQFILELGYGFCFVGRQHRLTLGKKEYFIDLLFYHRFLKALVAIDLKVGPFEPAHAGQMDFYLNVLNDKERGPDDRPSIGIILCAEKDNLEVEFALRTKINPIGVAEYQLQPKLPARFKGKLPSPEQLTEALRPALAGKART
jgi:predicted nuclease of restriction endonuclease-like (RecB) superfamily